MEQFRMKTPEEVDQQLHRTESLLGNRIQPENTRAEILGLSLSQLKERYPQEYKSYFSVLKFEGQLSHFLEGEHISEKPEITLLQAGARGRCFKVETKEMTHVIKPLETLLEKDISAKAGELGIGPKQFKTKEGYLHEEFIKGTPLLELEKEKCTPEFMEDLGRKFFRALKKLHENNILVNDQILVDGSGKSHMIIDETGEVRCIDFGASVDLSEYPNLDDEAVFSLIRTDPFMSFSLYSGTGSGEDQKNLIQGYRENILSELKTKEDLIQMKDGQLLGEGLYFLSERLPNVSAFVEGVRKEGF